MGKGHGVSGHTHSQSQLDHYANQNNPNNSADQANNDNHANQCNPNNDEYWHSRDNDKKWVASIKDALETGLKVQKPLILLTFWGWHLLRRYNTNERHPFGCLFRLVAMKRTDGAWKMKQDFVLWSEPSAHGEVSVRFASRERKLRSNSRVLHGAGAPLHVCEANASLTKLWIHDIIISTNNHKTSGLLAIFRHNVCYPPKGAQKR